MVNTAPITALTPNQKALVSHLLSWIFLCTALLIPPSVLSHTNLALVSIPLILSCDIYTYSHDPFRFLAAVHALWSFELLIFRNPREKYKLLRLPVQGGNERGVRIEEEKEGERAGGESSTFTTSTGKKEEMKKTVNDDEESWKKPYPTTLLARFFWVTKLIVSFRYTGWETASPSSTSLATRPVHTPISGRILFVLHRLAIIGGCFLVFDASSYYQSKDTYFQILTDIDDRLPKSIRFTLAHYHIAFLPPRALRILAFGAQQYCTFNILSALVGIVGVVLGGIGIADWFWGAPENWNLLMGGPVAVWERGLRGFWGKVWHQLSRRILIAPAKAVLSLVGMRQQTLLTYSFQVITAFAISSVLYSTTLPKDIKGVDPVNYASFFWYQAGFVMLETVASRILEVQYPRGQRTQLQRYGLSVLKVVWTLSVLYHTVPFIEGEVIKVGRKVGLSKPIVVGKMSWKDFDVRKRYFK